MNVLILNWRDPLNPKAGGAEKLNLRILEIFQKKGAKVTWFAESVSGLPQEETYKGIRIIRKGNSLTTHFLFPKSQEYDLVIDCIHGFGYLSNFFFPKAKRIILICEAAKNIWDEMVTFPTNKMGKFLEPLMFKLYKNEKFWTISRSTEKDLVEFGIPKKNIAILPMGFDAVRVNAEKYKVPTALFVGRLTEQKGVKDAVRAIALANQESKNKWNLNIIGRGAKQYESELKELIKELKVSNYVKFMGFLSEKEKFTEMTKSWILIVPSSREGWGMIIPEANYQGTPAVAYDAPGLVDSVKYSKRNILVNHSYSEIARVLLKTKIPRKVKEKLEPGWLDLQAFVALNK